MLSLSIYYYPPLPLPPLLLSLTPTQMTQMTQVSIAEALSCFVPVPVSVVLHIPPVTICCSLLCTTTGPDLAAFHNRIVLREQRQCRGRAHRRRRVVVGKIRIWVQVQPLRLLLLLIHLVYREPVTSMVSWWRLGSSGWI